MGRLASALMVLLCLVMLIAVEVVKADDDHMRVQYPLNLHDITFAPPDNQGGHDHVSNTQASGDTPSPAPATASPTTFFEVDKPIEMPDTSKLLCSSCILKSQVFNDTGGAPPATSQFGICTRAAFNKVVLRWEGTCSARQFGRISTVWLGGVEILRTCTPEFPDGGGSWTFKKDITRFTTLLKKPRKVTVELGNVLDTDYKGAFNISIYLDFYQTGLKRQFASPDPASAPPHQIKAVSLPNPQNGGYWFRVGGQDYSETVSKQIVGLPRNAYRAVLEICVSSHGDDESWFTNPPNNYAQANNFTFGNGPFRDISAYIDGEFVGAVWPFPLVYTGGFNPLAWRPALPIGTAVLPSYDLELTPFLSYLIDGNPHNITFTITNSLSVWLIDANLHLWVDKKVQQTSSSLVSYDVPYYNPSDNSQFSGVDGQFVVSAMRGYSFAGSVVSSQGKRTVCVTSYLTYNNTLLLENNFGYQTANLLITSHTEVLTTNDTLITASYKKATKYPFGIVCVQTNGPNNSTDLNCSIAHGMSSDEFAMFPKGTFVRSMNNTQSAAGKLMVAADNTVSGGTGSLQQQYDYKSTKGCYQRSISTLNDVILSDSSSSICTPCPSCN